MPWLSRLHCCWLPAVKKPLKPKHLLRLRLLPLLLRPLKLKHRPLKRLKRQRLRLLLHPLRLKHRKLRETASIDGKSVYNKTCSMCHAAGVAGAPKPGDKENWAPRIAQGTETLYKHSIEGYTGNSGMMPARGGNPKLTDDEMKAAVDFMVAQSK